MLRFSTWKIVSILGMIVVAILLVVPSMLGAPTRAALDSHMPSWAKPRTLTLGLDLQGGSHILLQVDGTDVVKTMVGNLRDDVRRILREDKVATTGGIGTKPRGVEFRIADAGEQAKVMPKLRALANPTASVFGSAGGSAYSVSAEGNTIDIDVTDAGVTDKIRRAVDQSIEVIRRRVDALGTTEPLIEREGNDRVLVEVPGLQDPDKLKQILGTTAKLTFQLVAEPGANPGDVEQLDDAEHPGQKVAVEKRIMVEGGDLTDAQPGFDQQTQQPIVNFKFNIRGGQRFGQVTSENVGRPFAIVLDAEVI